MLVIHGIWARDALCLWAEDSTLPAVPPAPAGGRPSRVARPHPFAADPDALAGALGVLGDGLRDLAGKAAADELTLWLPSAGPGPGPSPELTRPPGPDAGEAGPSPRRGSRPALGCWRVPALAFGAAAARTILASLDPVDTLAGAALHPEVIAGGSAVYWAAVARFAADLCVRGRVLPGLARRGDGRAGDGWSATWRTVLTGPDAPRAAELAAAMPPLCRSGEPGGEPPGPLLAAALDALADAAARGQLDAPAAAGAPGWALLPPRRGRRPARVPVPERWAAALTGPDAEVEVATAEDEAEAAALATSLDAWHAASQAPAGPVRTCFRLVEPVQPKTSHLRTPSSDRPNTEGRGTSSSPCSPPRIPA